MIPGGLVVEEDENDGGKRRRAVETASTLEDERKQEKTKIPHDSSLPRTMCAREVAVA
jgi:hypothetical protein